MTRPGTARRTRRTDPLPEVPTVGPAEIVTALTAERDGLLRAWSLRSSAPGERRRLAKIEQAIARKA